MQADAEGIFFDGHSSRPFTVTVRIDSARKKIIFSSTEILEIEWHIADLTADLTGSKVTIRPLLDSEKILLVDDGLFSVKFFELFRKAGKGNFYHRFIHLGSLFQIGIVLFIALIATLGYFYFVPWLGEKAVSILPVSYDEGLGKSIYENIISTEKIDSSKTEALKKFAGAIKFDTERKLNFTVIQSKEINAFALPDGNIVVYTGILEKINSYQQLAALLSHEASHVIYRHSMKELCRSVSGYIVFSIITSDANAIMAVLANHANKLNNLSYSRSFEKEADEKGFDCMLKNNVDPNGMLELFEILKENEKVEMPEFLSTHPLTKARIEKAKELIETSRLSKMENHDLEEKFLLIKN